MTVATCVCCSMISETQTAYGDAPRQGRSRLWMRYQSSKCATIRLFIIPATSGSIDTCFSLAPHYSIALRMDLPSQRCACYNVASYFSIFEYRSRERLTENSVAKIEGKAWIGRFLKEDVVGSL